MHTVSKISASLVLAGAALALTSGAAHALLWWDEPFLGLAPVNTFCSTVNGVNTCTPDSNTNPSQAIFDAPIPGTYIYATSAVLMTAGSVYDVTRTATNGIALIDFGHLPWDGGDYLAITQSGFGDAGDLAPCGGTWDTCLGPWTYTESWTGTQGPDAGRFISSSITFCVENDAECTGFVSTRTTVPEPATLALLGLGLAGLGFGRRKQA